MTMGGFWMLFVCLGCCLIGALAAAVDSASSPTGSCHHLDGTHEEKLRNPCSSVVDYDFFVPQGLSMHDLEVQARNILNSSIVVVVAPSCGQRVVALFCAQIYLKCYSGVNFADVTTYNRNIYQQNISIDFPVPFYRPCGSLCAEVRQYCSPTLYAFASTLPSCNARYDYSFGQPPPGLTLNPFRYEKPDNLTLCYRTKLIPFAGQVENYLHNDGTSFCSGFAGRVFTPPGSAVNASYTVIQAPGVSQNVTFDLINNATKRIPVFMGEDCLRALKKYLCYQALLPVMSVTLRQALVWSQKPSSLITQIANSPNAPALGLSIYVPMMANRSVCEEYAQTCKRFIATSTSANMVPNCTSFARNRPGVYAWPIADQTITTVTTTGILGDVKFYSSPANDSVLYYNSAQEYDYKTQCPRGFVVPDHPDDEGTSWVGGTGCAVGCQVPIWSTDEWNSQRSAQIGVPIASIIISAALFLVLVANPKDLEKYYLVLFFDVISITASLTTLIVNAKYGLTRVCYDNSIPYTEDRGGRSPCTAQGAVLTYCLLAGAACCAMMAVHHMVINTNDCGKFKNPTYYVVQCLVIFGLPIIPVAIISHHGMFGFIRTAPWCYVMPPTFDKMALDVKTVAVPILIGMVACAVALVVFTVRKRKEDAKGVKVAAVEYELPEVKAMPSDAGNSSDKADVMVYEAIDNDEEVCTSPKARTVIEPEPDEEKGDSAKMKETVRLVQPKPEGMLNRTNVLLVLVICIICTLYVPYAANKLVGYARKGDFQHALAEWIRCVFTNYHGDDSEWEAVCGMHPEQRPDLSFSIYMTIIYSGSNIFMGPLAIVLLIMERMRSKKV